MLFKISDVNSEDSFSYRYKRSYWYQWNQKVKNFDPCLKKTVFSLFGQHHARNAAMTKLLNLRLLSSRSFHSPYESRQKIIQTNKMFVNVEKHEQLIVDELVSQENHFTSKHFISV